MTLKRGGDDSDAATDGAHTVGRDTSSGPHADDDDNDDTERHEHAQADKHSGLTWGGTQHGTQEEEGTEGGTTDTAETNGNAGLTEPQEVGADGVSVTAAVRAKCALLVVVDCASAVLVAAVCVSALVKAFVSLGCGLLLAA